MSALDASCKKKNIIVVPPPLLCCWTSQDSKTNIITDSNKPSTCLRPYFRQLESSFVLLTASCATDRERVTEPRIPPDNHIEDVRDKWVSLFPQLKIFKWRKSIIKTVALSSRCGVGKSLAAHKLPTSIAASEGTHHGAIPRSTLASGLI